MGSIERRILALGGQAQPARPIQGVGTPQLGYPTPGSPYITQSGFLPPVSPASRVQGAGVTVIGAPGGGWIMPVALGGLALLFLMRR